MGLDATVYCNCFENGRLSELPNFPELVFVAPDGGLDCKSEDLETQREFDQWLLYRACEHEDGVLLNHYFGNIALISLLHTELLYEAEKFPVILQKILDSGIHAGDYVSLENIENLRFELSYLGSFVCNNPRNQEFVNWFSQQLNELVNIALQVGKPISF